MDYRMLPPIDPAKKVYNPYEYADEFYGRLEKHVEETRAQLKEGEQLAMFYYPRSGEAVVITDIGYRNPYLITLFGQDSQMNECHVLVHVQSVELVLKIVKSDAKVPRKGIGFIGDVAQKDEPSENDEQSDEE